ncbi:AlwI family type II restriction endonuclease [bacterium]|nr:AlwI family type II restriction endonuclease [bacterium]
METLWSMSTTVREAERIIGFLQTALELDGEVWNKDNQKKFQILLIKNRQYLNDPDNTQSFSKLSAEQVSLLKDKSVRMTYEQAKEIFEAKDYNDPPMRGRQSMSPLTKLGLVYIEKDKRVAVSDVGHRLINGDIDFSDFMLEALLKFQYPNPYESGFKTWDTKPFINTLRLIKLVNEKCRENGLKEKGISKIEFGIFALSLQSFELVEKTAAEILEFRKMYEAYTDEALRDKYISDYIKEYLGAFKNPEKNIKEYTDNMIRYLRLTKYIYIRGKYANTYIDLEPRRMTEINSILEADDGSAQAFSDEEWRNYMGIYGKYSLPFETVEKLSEIVQGIQHDINRIEGKIGLKLTRIELCSQKEALKQQIDKLRLYRTELQNLELKKDYHEDIKKIEEAIESLEEIRKRNKAGLSKKFSIELEKWANVALNVINDAILIKPNYPVGDDNEPIYTAPNGAPDIECYYDSFGAICEVTMLTSRDQWYNEGQPVMRHLRQFEVKNSRLPNYCLFVAPSLHIDTVNTFYMSVKYEYEGAAQKIIPITISQLENILEAVKQLIIKGKTLPHSEIMKLYDRCCSIAGLSSSKLWLEHIAKELNSWFEGLAALAV